MIEIVTKLFLVIQNATGKPPQVNISTEFDANFGSHHVTFSFKVGPGWVVNGYRDEISFLFRPRETRT